MKMTFKITSSVTGILLVATMLRICFGSDASIETGLQFTEEPQSMIVQKNYSALLNCSAIGAPGGAVVISWRKDGTEVVSDRRVLVLTNGSLSIRRVIHNVKRHFTDEGWYECVATNHVGAIVSHQAFLRVSDLNHFSGHPQSSTVTMGETAHFHCEISGVPKPTVTWEKNRLPLPLSDRYFQLPSYSLLIYRTSSDDAGTYSCRAENVAGERISKEAELTINSLVGVHYQHLQPRILVGPKDQEVTVGETVLLECAAMTVGGDSQPLILWSRKDGLPLPRERIRMFGFHYLEIQDVQETDAGVISCSLPDWANVRPMEAMLTVMVPPRPVEPSENILRPTAHTVRMTCEFDGNPAPNITWMKNGELVKSNGRIKMKADSGTLLIAQSTASDSGLYQCWAENAAGRDGMIIRLFIQPSDDAPDPPQRLEAQTLSSRSIELTWEESPPKNGRRTMAYSVHYLPTNGGNELQKVVQEPRAIIEQLQPYSMYTLYTVAYNDRSASQHSRPVMQMTDEDVPTSAPEIQVFPAGVTSLRVQWDDLVDDKARGAITRYQVFYRRHGQAAQNVVRIDGHINQYNINGLETGVKYDIRVLAGTQVGFPTLLDDQWPWVSQVVSSSINIGVTGMTNVQFVVANSTTIHLFWDLPTSVSVELLGFKISYKVQGSAQESKMIILDAVTSHPIHQLKPDTVYEIGICPFTDLGDGHYITKVVRTLPDGVIQGPPVPITILAEPLNDTAIRLTWSESEFKDTTVTHFTVHYLPLLSESPHPILNESVIHSIESQVSQVVVTDLSPFTVYQFTVQSHTSSSHSQLSQEVRCRTKEGRPEAPQNVVIFLVAPTDIQVNWQPPQISNGFITSYIICYSSDEMASISKWLSQVENGTATTSTISGLKPSTLYYIKIQATTSRCEGRFSKTLELWTRDLYQNSRRNESHLSTYSDRTMGIIIGICISGGCIIICIIIIALRNRLFLCDHRRQAMHSVNGYAAPVQDRGNPGSAHLMPHSVTMACTKDHDSSSLMLNKSQDNKHLDSKGGPVAKKKFNGKQNDELFQTNGFAVFSEQNDNMTRNLLSRFEAAEFCKISSSASASEVALRNSLCLPDDSHATEEATTKV